MSCRLVDFCRLARAVVLALCVVLSAASPARAAQVVVGADPDRDLWHTVQARKVLAEDPELAGLNLGVRVRNRVATLWGPVPTPDLAFKAEIRLRNLIELVEVNNELFVSGEAFAAMPEATQTPVQPLLLPEQLPPALPPPAAVTPPPSTGERKAQKPAPEPTPQSQPTELPQELELPLLRLPRGEANTTSQRQDVDRLLTLAVDALVQSKDAFRPFRYTVSDRTVFLQSPGPRSNAVHELARAIARLPGVEGVVLQDSPR